MLTGISHRFGFDEGIIFASFQAGGHFCVQKVLFNVVQTGSSRTSRNCFNTQFGNPSGPDAL